MSSRPKQVLIIGAGVFGASTAYHLQSQINPPKVTLVDLSPYGDPTGLGASVDVNKIIRSDYSSPFYMDLAFQTFSAWKTWSVCPQKITFHHYPPPLTSPLVIIMSRNRS